MAEINSPTQLPTFSLIGGPTNEQLALSASLAALGLVDQRKIALMVGDSEFANGNGVFGISATSISGTTITATVPGNLLYTGAHITVGDSGANSPFDGTWPVTIVDATHVTFVVPGLAVASYTPVGLLQYTVLENFTSSNMYALANAKNGQPLKIYNAAVAGWRSDQVVAQFANSVNIPNLHRVAIHQGINNIQQAASNATDQNAAIAQVLADDITLIEYCIQRGLIVDLFTLPPLGSTATLYTALRRQSALKVNANKRILARRYNIFLWDTYATCVDYATGNWRTNYSSDALHYQPLACSKIAVADYATAAFLQYGNTILPRVASAIDNYQSDATSYNITYQPMMTGTGGSKVGGSGTLVGTPPDNCHLVIPAATTTVTSSSPARSDGRGLDWQCDCVGSATDTVTLARDGVQARYTSGDTIQFEFLFKLTSNSGSRPNVSPQLQMTTAGRSIQLQMTGGVLEDGTYLFRSGEITNTETITDFHALITLAFVGAFDCTVAWACDSAFKNIYA